MKTLFQNRLQIPIVSRLCSLCASGIQTMISSTLSFRGLAFAAITCLHTSCATTQALKDSADDPLNLLLTPLTLITDAGHMVSGGALDDEFTASAWGEKRSSSSISDSSNTGFSPVTSSHAFGGSYSSFSPPASPAPASVSSSPSVLAQPSVSSQKGGGSSWDQITPPRPCNQININGEPGFYNPNPFTVKVLYVVRLKEGPVTRRTQPFESAIRGEVYIPAMKSGMISLGLNQRLHGDTIVGVVSYHTLRAPGY